MKKIILILAMLLPTFAVGQPVLLESPSIGSVEVAFSPNNGAQELVLKLIRSSRSDIQMMAYTLTSKPIVDALVKAKRRGVDVAVAVDKANLKLKTGRYSLAALLQAGVEIKTISKFKAMQDNVLIVDGRHVEIGSFNYTRAANVANSEHVTVFWNAPDMVNVYFNHWQRRWRDGVVLTSVQKDIQPVANVQPVANIN